MQGLRPCGKVGPRTGAIYIKQRLYDRLKNPPYWRATPEVQTWFMMSETAELSTRLQIAYLGVRRLVESAPLNHEQMNELEEYVKTFWRIALQISENPPRQFQA